MEQQGETGITQISPVFPKRHQLLVVAEVDAASLKILRFLSWDAQSAHCPAEIPLPTKHSIKMEFAAPSCGSISASSLAVVLPSILVKELRDTKLVKRRAARTRSVFHRLA